MAISTACSKVELEPVRAEIDINGYIIQTPYVKSFSVNKSRSSNIGTFSATIEVPVDAPLGSGASSTITISAGTRGNVKLVFTGFIKQIVPNPCPGKPNYMLLTLSGKDIMSRLENKKFSRRIRSDGPGVFVVIDGMKGARPTAFWSTDKRIRSGQNRFTSSTPALDGRKEHNDLTRAPDFSKTNTSGFMGPLSEIVPEPGKPGVGGLSVHDHSAMNKGGPAFGVFSIS